MRNSSLHILDQRGGLSIWVGSSTTRRHSYIHYDVVNQSRVADCGCDRNRDCTFELRDWRHGAVGKECNVLELYVSDLVNFATHGPANNLRVSFAVGDHLLSTLQRTRQHERATPLVRRQIAVARAHREAVGLANRRTHAYFDRHVEIVNDLPYDDCL